jgi:IPT/TIG domain
MMGTIRVLAVLLLVTLMPTTAQASPCPGKVAFAFINGIWVSPDDYIIDKEILRDKLQAELGCTPVIIDAYNTSASKASDLYESSQLLGNPIDPQLAEMILTGTIDLAEEQFGTFAQDAATFFINELVDNIASLEGDITSPLEADFKSHLASYESVLASGYRLVIVGHSEGNLFANAEYDALLSLSDANAAKVTVVGIATPSFRVAGDPTNTHYATVHGDFIWKVVDFQGRKALPANVVFDPCATDASADHPLEATECHYFETYMGNGWRDIFALIQPAVPPTPPPPPTPSNQPPTAAFSMTDGSQLVNNPGTLNAYTDATSGLARITFADTSTDPDGPADIVAWDWKVNTQTGSLCSGTSTCIWSFAPGGPYAITLHIRDSAGNLASASGTLNVYPASGTLPRIDSITPPSPIAAQADQTVTITGANFQSTLSVTVGLPGGETSTLSGSGQIQNVSPGSFTAIITFADPGTYMLTVRNPDGGTSTPFVVNVISAAVTAHHFYTLQPNPAAGGAPLVTDIAVDSQGRLLVGAKFCNTLFCGSRLLSLSSNAALNWDAPKDTTSGFAPGYFSSDPLAPNRVNIGADDRVYMQAADGWLFGVNALGDAIPTSPWSMTINEQTAGFAHRRPVIVDPIDGTVYMKGGVATSFTGFPSAIGAFTADGLAKWPAIIFPGGARNWGLTLGPNRDVFSIVNDSSTLVAIDPNSGSVMCETPVVSYFDVLVGGAAGAFTSVGNTMTRFDASCQRATAFETDRDELILQDYVNSGVVLATDDFAADFQSTVRLLGIGTDGTFLWRNPEIAPDILGGQDPIAATSGDIAYVLGTDLNDGLHKVFAVHSRTGAILFRYGTSGICDRCIVAPAPGGVLYVADLNAADIFVLTVDPSVIAGTGIMPAIASLTPTSPIASPQTQTLLVNGNDFQTDLSVTVTFPGGGASTLSGTQIQNVTATSFDALITFADPGQYTLTVHNPDGTVSVPFEFNVAGITTSWFVAPPAPVGTIGAPVFSNVATDQNGNLLLSEIFVSTNCGFGYCGNRLLSVSPRGSVRWDVPAGQPFFSNDLYAQNVVAVSPVDSHVYFAGTRNTLFGFDIDGLPLSGWPITLTSDGGSLAYGHPFLIDGLDGSVVAQVGDFLAPFNGTSIVGLNPDGSPHWSTVNSSHSDGHAGMVQGPNRDLYTAVTDGCCTLSPTAVVGIRHDTGATICTNTNTRVAFNYLVGGEAGVFGTAADINGGPSPDMLAFDAQCNNSVVFTTNRASLSPWNVVGNVVVAVDYDIGGDPTTARLLAVNPAGGLLWRNHQIRPVSPTRNSFPHSVFESPIRAVLAGNLYVLGDDLTDGIQKLFVVDSQTGRVVQSTPLPPMCGTASSCELAASAFGLIYVVDTAASTVSVIK